MNLEQVEQELADIQAQMEPLVKRKNKLNEDRRQLRSQLFISVNGVTHDNLELSSGSGKPYFGHIEGFANWMKKTETTKRFCEWNGCIYFTSEIIAGRLTPDAPGRVSDLGGE